MEITPSLEFLHYAPDKLGLAFFHWVHEVEGNLSTSFVDWATSENESKKIVSYAQSLAPILPNELGIYYQFIFPFSHMRNGLAQWMEQYAKYQILWRKYSHDKPPAYGEEFSSQGLPSVVWPINCLRKYDVVGFATVKGEIAIMRLDPHSGAGRPIALGLRKYILTEIAIEVLANDIPIETVDFDKIRADFRISQLSGWPIHQHPQHIALNM